MVGWKARQKSTSPFYFIYTQNVCLQKPLLFDKVINTIFISWIGCLLCLNWEFQRTTWESLVLWMVKVFYRLLETPLTKSPQRCPCKRYQIAYCKSYILESTGYLEFWWFSYVDLRYSNELLGTLACLWNTSVCNMCYMTRIRTKQTTVASRYLFKILKLLNISTTRKVNCRHNYRPTYEIDHENSFLGKPRTFFFKSF